MALLHKTHGRGVVLALLAVGFHLSGCGGGVSDRDVRLTAAEIVDACPEVETAVAAREAASAASQAAGAARQAAEDEREALIDQLIAEDEQLAAAQAEWSAKVAEADERVAKVEAVYAKYARESLSFTKTVTGMRVAEEKQRRYEALAEELAWRRETINQLAADERMVNASERVAEADDRVAEADDRGAQAEDRVTETRDRVAEKADLLVRENSAALSGMRRYQVVSTCKTLLEADDPVSEARSLLADGVATGKKAREIFELTSEFLEACPDGNPAGWDEGDWRAFIATGDRIMGAELPQVCDREENSAVWEMDIHLSGICSIFGADSSWWEAADKGRLTLLCQQAPRGWRGLVKKVEEANLQW